MAKFRLEKKIIIVWDGNPKTATEFGYGDFYHNEFQFVGFIEAENERKAQHKARKLFKENNLGYCCFSGTGYTAFLQKVSTLDNNT